MKKEWNNDPVYGELPFKTVQKLAFKIEGLKDRDDAAFLQYQLLIKPEILRCHIEFSNQQGTLVYNPLDTNAETILENLPSPFKGEKTMEKTIAYKELIATNFHLE
ncbi:hypothetical protein KKE06_03500 [Candidatus Micrarchaeota archaeon]|nr:hypothetical protein [Candidatus Micrarchaeota archaeon]MBU1930957.1 hypothetical protein [Candidatus Micrarchaeota archaeon]